MTSITSSQAPQVIEKESIAALKFPSNEVLTNAELIAKRKENLEKAMSLGNLEYSKVKIIFEDETGIKQVETTVWGVTDKRVILKQDLLIPINRIHEVRI